MKLIEKTTLRTNWSVAELKELGTKLSRLTPEEDHFKLSSIRFYDSEDSIEVVFKQRKGPETVGGWRIVLSGDGEKYKFEKAEWFDT